MIRIEGDDIVVLRMEHGKVNALDVEFLNELIATLAELEARSPRAVVLTGNGTLFSAGADLRKVLAAEDSYIEAGVASLGRAFTALFAFPRPVVAAVNGHAIAGGAVIACACDHRVMARGSGLIGLAELRVGVPFPTAALEIVRYAVAARSFQELIYFGDVYDTEGALGHALVDEVVEPDRLFGRAMEVAERLGSIPPRSFAHTKKIMRAHVLDRIAAGAGIDVVAGKIWSEPDTREAISAFMEALRGRA